MNQPSSSARPTPPDGTPPAAAPAVTPAPQAPAAHSDRIPALAWVIAAVFVVAELAVSGRYGFQQDELYFIVAGHHLAFGYVDQPPLVPLLNRVTGVLGVSPTAIRIIPALAGGAVVAIAARLAALFGAGRFGRVLAALATACAPILIGADHIGNTTPLELLAWAAVLLCVTTALLRHRPRWWLGAGAAAGAGLQDNNLMVLLLAGLAAGILVSGHRSVLRTRWPWLGAGLAAVILAPNVVWQATHGWPQLAMASALHQQNSTAADYLGGLPAQLIYPGLLLAPLLVAGFVTLWRAPELRFIAVAATLTVVYVLAWVPGKVYYADGTVPALLAAGSLAAERWIARGRRPRLRRGAVVAAPLVGVAIILPLVLPIVPAGQVHALPASAQHSDVGDSIGWPQLTRAVAAQDAALARAGQRPTSIFTGYYGEAAALDVLGTSDHLPPVLSGHNAFWMWGPGHASDRTVLAVDGLGMLRPYFASCRLLTTYDAPYHVHNDWTGIRIGVCTGPAAGWPALWPRLKHYG
ncbi:MAG TPA: glycosyltransferase family 39 protein [Streptosporangiaceae bacterium]|nr:glycosyltransferase family 39 protein [Streptosporangiaceae bacterium]